MGDAKYKSVAPYRELLWDNGFRDARIEQTVMCRRNYQPMFKITFLNPPGPRALIICKDLPDLAKQIKELKAKNLLLGNTKSDNLMLDNSDGKVNSACNYKLVDYT